MSEKETKTISFKDIWNVVKKNLIFVLIIVIVSTAIGTVYAFFVKKTTYTVSTTAVVKVEGLHTGETGTEANYASFSVFLAPLCESVFTNKNNALRYKEVTEKTINVNAIRVEWQEQRFDLSITYSASSREDIREEVVDDLNNYIQFCIDYVDGKEFYKNGELVELQEPIWTSLENRIKFDMAMVDAVVPSTGKASTMAKSLLIGIALAVVFLIIRFYVDDTINDKEIVEEIVDAPVIASISISANFNREGGQNNEV